MGTKSKAEKQASLAEKETISASDAGTISIESPAAAVTSPSKTELPQAAGEPSAEPKPVGKIAQIITLSKLGYKNAEIIAAGFNKSTVNIQVAARKKDPAGYDQKHLLRETDSAVDVSAYIKKIDENRVAKAKAEADKVAAAPAPTNNTDNPPVVAPGGPTATEEEVAAASESVEI